MNPGAIHPLTGPVFVKGVKPADVLEIEFLDIQPQPFGFSCIIPGLGFLRDIMTEPFLVHWKIAGGWATSEQIPGVRVPGTSFMGVSAVAPSAEKPAEWTEREKRWQRRTQLCGLGTASGSDLRVSREKPGRDE